MSRRRTIGDIQRRSDAGWHAPGFSTYIHPPEHFGYLFQSKHDGCLTHRTRYVVQVKNPWGEHFSWVAECGIGINRAVVVDPRDEFFVCHKCIAVCERFGINTFNMVPATGCEVSNGRRGNTTRKRSQ